MTDLARSGEGTPPGESGPDWKAFARSGEWRRAQAAATLTQADPDTLSAVSALSAVQQDVRARKYASAQRGLSAYAGALKELDRRRQGEAALLRSLVAPEVLAQALSALENASGEADPVELQSKLAAAQAHALTRAEALNVVGVLHALRQEEGAARARFEEALTHDPQHYRARMNLGNLDLEAGRLPEAEAAYREVLQLAPDYDGAHHNLGVALRRQGKLYESVGAIRKAQRLGVQGARAEAKEEMQEQFRRDPRLKYVRVAVFAGFVVLLALLAWLGR
ncbi:tetratricopeptide repeat protein [Deinococcus sp. VB343]|uniref:Tetratricopeptide repeat protein n=1 Tax=Deinococcus sp. VB142 TaxID=3112952 RepID=A0AAU6Q1I1_9DEIO